MCIRDSRTIDRRLHCIQDPCATHRLRAAIVECLPPRLWAPLATPPVTALPRAPVRGPASALVTARRGDGVASGT
eukprot:1409491-Alexandrium_andersonii.AAC.1